VIVSRPGSANLLFRCHRRTSSSRRDLGAAVPQRAPASAAGGATPVGIRNTTIREARAEAPLAAAAARELAFLELGLVDSSSESSLSDLSLLELLENL
jgi:hypothetical protein